MTQKEYRKYLKSPHWTGIKVKYDFAPTTLKRCYVCEHKNYELHHLHYETLGKENILTDFLPLCRFCHDRFHLWIKENKKSLSSVQEFKVAVMFLPTFLTEAREFNNHRRKRKPKKPAAAKPVPVTTPKTFSNNISKEQRELQRKIRSEDREYSDAEAKKKMGFQWLAKKDRRALRKTDPSAYKSYMRKFQSEKSKARFAKKKERREQYFDKRYKEIVPRLIKKKKKPAPRDPFDF